MTASDVIEVEVPRQFPHQQRIVDHPARFKVWRAGRRTGKSRMELHCSIFGHGPGRCWKGMVHGRDVGWVAPDFTQADIIWSEEIKPRFEGVEGWTLSEKHHALTLDGYGTLFLISFENIRALRGRGKRLGGVVVDEGAHFDLRYAWRSVIRPTLMDCEGWAIFGSTTNAGPDGAMDSMGQRRVPSFFNTLCEQIMGGLRGAEWMHWHSDARQNPIVSPKEFEALSAEYDDDGEAALKEEVYAELLHGGAGLAFPEWDVTLHVQAIEPTVDDACAAGMDWGHGTPGWFGVVYTRPNQQLLMRHELYFKRTRAKKVGFQIGKLCLAALKSPEYIALDSACFNTTGVGATIAEKIQEGIEIAYARQQAQDGVQREEPTCFPAPKGPEAVRTQTALLHEVLGWERDKDGVLVEPPTLIVHPDCRDFCRTVSKIPLDPRDANKFDTKSEDHAVQGFAYLLVSRTPEYRAPRIERATEASRRALDPVSRHEAEEFDAVIERLAKRRSV